MTGPTGRLLALLSLLQARRDWPGPVLAARLETSQRTVRRDVDRLRELGYPIRATRGPEGGYRLAAGADLPPLLLDDEQAVAVAVALQVATTAGAGVGEPALRALTTVTQLMPARLRHRVEQVQVEVVERSGGARVDPEVLVALSGAVRAREVVRFDYGDAPAPPRRAEPHHVVSRAGRWYLVAWDLDRTAWRTFRVDRVRLRTPNGPRFTPRQLPGGDVTTFVNARFKGSSGVDEWPCRGEVVLGCAAREVAPYVGPDSTLEPLGPDRCRLRTGAWSWVGLAAGLGRLDAEVEVVGPQELRDAFATLAVRYAATAGGGRQPG